MRIAVFGTGGAGGYFGAQLGRAGEELILIARGAHLEAIRRDGMIIETPAGELVVKPALATDDPQAAGPVDLVLVGVKAWQLRVAVVHIDSTPNTDQVYPADVEFVGSIPTVLEAFRAAVKGGPRRSYRWTAPGISIRNDLTPAACLSRQKFQHGAGKFLRRLVEHPVTGARDYRVPPGIRVDSNNLQA